MNKYKGVVFVKPVNKFRARFCICNSKISLGYFDNEYDAAKAVQMFEQSFSRTPQFLCSFFSQPLPYVLSAILFSFLNPDSSHDLFCQTFKLLNSRNPFPQLPFDISSLSSDPISFNVVSLFLNFSSTRSIAKKFGFSQKFVSDIIINSRNSLISYFLTFGFHF